eukprot:508943_1
MCGTNIISATLISLLTLISALSTYALWNVLPFYIIETASDPNYSWDKNDISILYTVYAIGSVIGSQILLYSSKRKSKHKSKGIKNIAIGHIIQIFIRSIGFALLLNFKFLFKFNYYQFAIGIFLIGISSSEGSLQIYAKNFGGDNIELQRKCMSYLYYGKYISKPLATTIVMFVYDTFNFNLFAIISIICSILYMIMVFFIIIIYINKKPNISDNKSDTEYNNENEEDLEKLKLFEIISSSSCILILCVSINLAGRWWYYLSLSILYVEDFKISATTTGYLSSIGLLLILVIITINTFLRKKFPTYFEYPFDFLFYFILFGFGNLAFLILPPYLWVAILFQLITDVSARALDEIESITRLGLAPIYPKNAFQQITAYKYISISITVVIGGVVATPFLLVDKKFPFLINVCVVIILSVLIIVSYIYRRKKLKMYLMDHEIHDNETVSMFEYLMKQSYILTEKYYFSKLFLLRKKRDMFDRYVSSDVEEQSLIEMKEISQSESEIESMQHIERMIMRQFTIDENKKNRIYNNMQHKSFREMVIRQFTVEQNMVNESLAGVNELMNATSMYPQQSHTIDGIKRQISSQMFDNQ